jgi:hypothetical protein
VKVPEGWISGGLSPSSPQFSHSEGVIEWAGSCSKEPLRNKFFWAFKSGVDNRMIIVNKQNKENGSLMYIFWGV